MEGFKSLFILGLGVILGLIVAENYMQYNGTLQIFKDDNNVKLESLINFIQDTYVDAVDIDQIVDEGIEQMLRELDPHSTYIHKTYADQVKQRMRGDFVGIGINYSIHKDTIVVINTIAGGPSSRAGIKPGDRILLVDNDTLYGVKAQDENRISYLKGEEGSQLALQVYRPQEGIINYNIERAVVPIASVQACFMIDQSTAYIRIERFSQTTYSEFMQKLEKLPKFQNIIIDLRQNGGGYVKPALQIVDEFLEKGTLIMYTKDRAGDIEESIATGSSKYKGTNAYLLIDENSASASEIIAGAFQDNDRATIIGRRSFGKGLVQQFLEFQDGSSARITVSRYFTPSGRSIQRPYVKGDKKSYYEDYSERYTSGELQDSSKIKVNDSLIFKTKSGRIVYGGGGIIPDVYIERNNDSDAAILEALIDTDAFSDFIFEELENNRKYYNSLSLDDFKALEIPDSLIVRFKKDLGVSEVNQKDTNALLRTYVKASIAKQLYGTGAACQMIIPIDPFVEKCQAVIIKNTRG